MVLTEAVWHMASSQSCLMYRWPPGQRSHYIMKHTFVRGKKEVGKAWGIFSNFPAVSKSTQTPKDQRPPLVIHSGLKKIKSTETNQKNKYINSHKPLVGIPKNKENKPLYRPNVSKRNINKVNAYITLYLGYMLGCNKHTFHWLPGPGQSRVRASSSLIHHPDIIN